MASKPSVLSQLTLNAGSTPRRRSCPNQPRRRRHAPSQQCVGSFHLVYALNQVVRADGASFISREEDDAAWANVPVFTGTTNLLTDRIDVDTIDHRPISAETFELLMATPIDQLIISGSA